MDSTHAQTTSGVTCHHRLWTAHIVERRWACHEINAYVQHRRSDDVWHSIPSPPLDSTHGRMTSGVACHHCPWTAHIFELSRAWRAIIALERQTRLNDVRGGMPSSPLDNTNYRSSSGVALHHHLWTTHTVDVAWHDITALELHARSDDIGRGLTSPPLDSAHGRQRRAWHYIAAFGQHVRLDDVGHDMPSSPLGSTNG